MDLVSTESIVNQPIQIRKMETEPPLLTEDELIKRHKQERKNLQSKIQSLKKTITKGDRKKKKEVTEEIVKLEHDLEQQQAAELAAFNQSTIPPNTNNVEVNIDEIQEKQTENDEANVNNETSSSPSSPTPSSRITRASRRRQKKANEEHEREKRINEQIEKSNRNNPRIEEMSIIENILKQIKLKLYNIPADGNCLYCAIIHQLEMHELEKLTITKLRKSTSEFIRLNKDDFLPFMYNELDDNEQLDETYFNNYCNEIATTKLWGGQLELRAISNLLKLPIKIIQANGPPTIQGEQFNGPELIITYHRYLYRLGEHYNSTIPDNDENITDQENE